MAATRKARPMINFKPFSADDFASFPNVAESPRIGWLRATGTPHGDLDVAVVCDSTGVRLWGEVGERTLFGFTIHEDRTEKLSAEMPQLDLYAAIPFSWI